MQLDSFQFESSRELWQCDFTLTNELANICCYYWWCVHLCNCIKFNRQLHGNSAIYLLLVCGRLWTPPNLAGTITKKTSNTIIGSLIFEDTILCLHICSDNMYIVHVQWQWLSNQKESNDAKNNQDKTNNKWKIKRDRRQKKYGISRCSNE